MLNLQMVKSMRHRVGEPFFAVTQMVQISRFMQWGCEIRKNLPLMTMGIFLLLIIPDIGDKARVVYVLDNTDSSWDMAHQSPHHYANALDWGNFKLSKSVWVGEKMFEQYTQTNRNGCIRRLVTWEMDLPEWHG